MTKRARTLASSCLIFLGEEERQWQRDQQQRLDSDLCNFPLRFSQNHSHFSLSDPTRLAVHPLKHTFPFPYSFLCLVPRFSRFLGITLELSSLTYLPTTHNNRTLSIPLSRLFGPHTYHPQWYYLTAYIYVFAPDSRSPPHFFPRRFCTIQACLLYYVILSAAVYTRPW